MILVRQQEPLAQRAQALPELLVLQVLQPARAQPEARSARSASVARVLRREQHAQPEHGAQREQPASR